MNVVRLEAGTVGLHQEAADLVAFVLHLGPDDGDVGDRARRDPHLLAVQHVLVADLLRARAHAAGIRSEVGLGQPKQPSFSPFCMAGSHVFFCSSLPKA